MFCVLLGTMVGMAQTATGARPPKGGSPEAAAMKNPVASSPESIAAGRRLYGRWCTNCHGPSGKGDGPGASSGAQPADLSDAMWDYGSSDGDIFLAVREGTSADMGSYKDRLSDTDIWNVVVFIRTLGAAGK